MGKITTVNATDKVMIPGIREAFKRQTNIGSGYLEARIGMFYTFVPELNDDTGCSTEVLSTTTYQDLFTFGLKDSSDIPPGQDGSVFMGLMYGTNAPGGGSGIATYSTTLTLQSNTGAAAVLQDVHGGGDHYANILVGSNLLIKGWQQQGSTQLGYPVFSTGDCNAFVGVKFVVTNLGASNQTVNISSTSPNTLITDVSTANLRSKIFNSSYGTPDPYTFATGIAVPLPDNFYVRCPFLSNRIRITNMAAYKVS